MKVVRCRSRSVWLPKEFELVRAEGQLLLEWPVDWGYQVDRERLLERAHQADLERLGHWEHQVQQVQELDFRVADRRKKLIEV